MDSPYEERPRPAFPLSIPPAPDWVRLPMYRARFTVPILAFLVLVWVAMTAYALLRDSGQDIGSLILMGPTDSTLNDFGAKVNDLIRAGEWWRLFTATILHIGLIHLLFNGWALYLFGPMIERFYGPGRYLVIYLVAGLGGSIASFAFSPVDSAGASGAIFGLIGALAAFFWLHRRLTGAQGRAQLINALYMIGLNLGLGLTVLRVDNWGHLGGLVAGAIAGLALAPRYVPGRQIAPDERLLQDRITPPAAAAISLGLGLATAAAFLVSLVVTHQ